MKYIIHFLLLAGVVYLTPTYILPYLGLSADIRVENASSALIFSVMLAIVNLVAGTILRIISTPIRWLTLGAFSLVIWGVVIYVTDQLVPGVEIRGVMSLIVMTAIVTVTSLFLRVIGK